jgi:DNA-binding NarL/FixJ family response regulator
MNVSNISGTAYSSSDALQSSWSNQQLTQLKSLVDRGLPLDQIALELKRSPAAIKLEVAALGLNLGTK